MEDKTDLTDDIVKQAIENISKFEKRIDMIKKEREEKQKEIAKKEKKNDLLFYIWISIVIIGTIFSIISALSQKKVFDRVKIEKEISTAIKNDADINVVKHIYNNREIETFTFYTKKLDKEKYRFDIPLSQILNNLKVYFYLKGEHDSLYLQQLDIIIDTHESTNPFDKLELNQKTDFENLKYKLGDDFDMVSTEINRITEELHNKNLLVEKYLNKSNTSFIISIIALVLTIILSSYQIYQNRKDRKSTRNILELNIEDDSNKEPKKK